MIQQWQVAYLATALLFAIAAVVAGDHLRGGDPPAASTRCALAAAAGLLWPVIVVGLVQLWTIAHASHSLRQGGTAPAAETARVLVGTGTR